MFLLLSNFLGKAGQNDRWSSSSWRVNKYNLVKKLPKSDFPCVLSVKTDQEHSHIHTMLIGQSACLYAKKRLDLAAKPKAKAKAYRTKKFVPNLERLSRKGKIKTIILDLNQIFKKIKSIIAILQNLNQWISNRFKETTTRTCKNKKMQGQAGSTSLQFLTSPKCTDTDDPSMGTSNCKDGPVEVSCYRRNRLDPRTSRRNSKWRDIELSGG